MQWLLEAGPFGAVADAGRRLFDGVTIRLGEGALVALTGASGCGKSSLLRRVVGLDEAGPVSRRLAGESFAGSSLGRWRANVTLLAQDAPMVEGTLRDNLRLPYRLRSAAGRPFDETRAAALFQRVGLDAVSLDRAAETVSGGERHRLALVRALLWDPPVIVADEPLAGLDSDTAAVCVDLLGEFARRQGHAALVVFHEEALAARADRRLRMHGGGLEGAA